jgi:hypothetical protein
MVRHGATMHQSTRAGQVRWNLCSEPNAEVAGLVVGDQRSTSLIVNGPKPEPCSTMRSTKYANFTKVMQIVWHLIGTSIAERRDTYAFTNTAAFFYILTSKFYMPFWIVVHH